MSFHPRRTSVLFSAVGLVALGCATSDVTKPADTISDGSTAIPAFISLTPATVSVAEGGSITITPTNLDGSGQQMKNVNATWISSDTAVATVYSGRVKGIRSGSTYVHYKVGTKSDSSKVTVTDTTSTTTSGSTTGTTSGSTTGTTSGSTTGTTSGSTTGTTSGSTTGTTSGSTTGTTSGSTTGTTSGSTTGSGLTGLGIVSDDFSKYAGTAGLQAKITTAIGGTCTSNCLYGDGYNGTLASIDTKTLYNGHQTMMYTFPAGTGSVPALWNYLPNGQTISKMWLRVKIRFSPGFTTAGTGTVAPAYKLLGWAWAGNNGRSNLAITNTNQYVTDWTVLPTSTITESFAELVNPHITTEWTDGAWYDYIIYFETTSSTTIRQRWWMVHDGQTPVLQGDLSGTMSANGGTVPQVNRICLGLNFNLTRSATNTEYLWYGQWEVIDGSKYANPFNLSL